MLMLPSIVLLKCSLALIACAGSPGQVDEHTADETQHVTDAPPTVPATGAANAANVQADAAPDVIALLGTLEAAAADLRVFTANVTYIVEEPFTGGLDTRRGEFIYDHVGGTQGKRFAVLFDEHIIDSRKRTQLKHYIFDGKWLAEIDHENKQFFKREIIAPGESFDPLKLGEGPIPLPIGQSREEVLKRFVVTRIELPAEGPLSKLRDAFELDGLRLTPREGTPEANEFDRVDLFFDRATRLPVGIEAVERGAKKTKTVRFADIRRAESLDAAQAKKLDIAEPTGTDWQKDIRPWGG